MFGRTARAPRSPAECKRTRFSSFSEGGQHDIRTMLKSPPATLSQDTFGTAQRAVARCPASACGSLLISLSRSHRDDVAPVPVQTMLAPLPCPRRAAKWTRESLRHFVIAQTARAVLLSFHAAVNCGLGW
eukprot:7479723-Pyramimonas_sp.AAC.1